LQLKLIFSAVQNIQMWGDKTNTFLRKYKH